MLVPGRPPPLPGPSRALPDSDEGGGLVHHRRRPRDSPPPARSGLAPELYQDPVPIPATRRRRVAARCSGSLRRPIGHVDHVRAQGRPTAGGSPWDDRPAAQGDGRPLGVTARTCRRAGDGTSRWVGSRSLLRFCLLPLRRTVPPATPATPDLLDLILDPGSEAARSAHPPTPEDLAAATSPLPGVGPHRTSQMPGPPAPETPRSRRSARAIARPSPGAYRRCSTKTFQTIGTARVP